MVLTKQKEILEESGERSQATFPPPSETTELRSCFLANI